MSYRATIRCIRIAHENRFVDLPVHTNYGHACADVEFLESRRFVHGSGNGREKRHEKRIVAGLGQHEMPLEVDVYPGPGEWDEQHGSDGHAHGAGFRRINAEPLHWPTSTLR